MCIIFLALVVAQDLADYVYWHFPNPHMIYAICSFYNNKHKKSPFFSSCPETEFDLRNVVQEIGTPRLIHT